MLDQLNSDPTGYLRDFAVTSGAEISLQSLQASLMHFVGAIWDRSIRGFYRLAVRTIDAYSAGLRYGTEEFKQNIYKSHRQVEDKSKW